MLGVKGAVQWLRQLKSVVIIGKNEVEITLSGELLEDVIQLIEYMDARNDRQNERMAEQREKIHGLLLK